MDNHEFRNIQKKLKLTNQGVSDVLGVRLQTVENWSSGVWEMPLMAEKFLHYILTAKNKQPYQDNRMKCDMGYFAWWK